jgi:heme-degrading monooxygenase HmoA
MHEAVGKVIDARKKEGIATKEAEADVAADLHTAAQEDTSKHRRQSHVKEGGPHIRSGKQPVTQITIVESEPEKQAEALALMSQRADFMARQPGFVSISVHRSLDGRRIVNYIQWESRELLQSAHQSPEFRQEWGRFDDLTDDIDPHLYEIAHIEERDAEQGRAR